MKKLSDKEEIIMQMLWTDGPQFVRQLVERFPEPKPHFNTVSTFVRGLEAKGFVGHEAIGNSHRYFPLVRLEDYRRQSLKGMLSRWFGGSALSMVSALIKEENISSEQIAGILEEAGIESCDSERKEGDGKP